MPQYLYQLSYTPESLAAQIKNPQDRLETAARPVLEAVGGRLIGGGFCFGDYDLAILCEAPDDESVAAVAAAVTAGGAVRMGKSTKLLSGDQWVSAMKKAAKITGSYKPPK
jgi:uncharacterized protein with GYD domain